MKLRRRGQADHEAASTAAPTATMVEEVSSQEAAPPPNRRRQQPLRARSSAPVVTSGEEATSGGDPHADAGDGEARQHPARKEAGKVWLRGLLDDQVVASREQAERDAALELRQFMAPAMDQLVLSVPGSSNAEEAGAILTRQAAVELDKPVEVDPSTVVDLTNPPEMGAYPSTEKLSNRVLRLANRHWTKGKPRSSEEVVAEKRAIAEQEFARKPAGTQRCHASPSGSRCRGVFVYDAEEQSSGGLRRCPWCQAPHVWDESTGEWTLIDDAPQVTTG